jgi:protein arginine kinase activator
MTCQSCRDEATVHLSERVGGDVREVHLCEACARAAGLPVQAAPPDLALDVVMHALITAHVGELVGELPRRRCPDCGRTFMDVRMEGRLGCPNDYDVFAAGLVPLLKKAHGASRHVGKRPRRRGDAARARLKLRAQLRAAVAREDYEAAARLRDQLRQRDPDR